MIRKINAVCLNISGNGASVFLQMWVPGVNAKLVWGRGWNWFSPLESVSQQQHLMPAWFLPPASHSSSLFCALLPHSLSPLCRPVWHSDGLASLAPYPPTSFRSLRTDSYTLAQGLFLAALLVTELAGTAPWPPPVIHSAQQTCKHSLPFQTRHPNPTAGLREPGPGCHITSPQSLEDLWNSAGLVSDPEGSALPMQTAKRSTILWVRTPTHQDW